MQVNLILVFINDYNMAFRPDPTLLQNTQPTTTRSFRPDPSLLQNRQQLGFFGTLNQRVQAAAERPGQALIGAAKGLGSTGFGLLKLGQSIGNLPPLRALGGGKRIDIIGEKPEFLKPKGLAQQFGFGAEQIAEFVVPIGKIAKIEKIPALLRIGIKGGVTSVEFAAKTAAQTGGDREAIIEAAKFGFAGGAIPPVLGGTAKWFRRGISEVGKDVLSSTTGVAEKAIEYATQRAKRVQLGFSADITATTLEREVTQGTKAMSKDAQKQFGSGIDKIQEEWAKQTTQKQKALNQQLRQQYKEVTVGFREIAEEFGVKFSSKGTITQFPTRIESGARGKIKQSYNVIKNHRDFSPKGMQNLAKDLQSLSKFEKGVPVAGQKISGRTPVVDVTIGRTAGFIRDTYPELGALRTGFSRRTRLIKEIGDVVKISKEGPAAKKAGVSKLTNIFKEDNDAYLETLIKFEEATGINILGRLAGTEFQKITPGIVRAGLAVGASIGAGIFSAPPLALLVLPIFSPRIVGETLTRASQISQPFQRLTPFVGPAIEAGTRALFRGSRSSNQQ